MDTSAQLKTARYRVRRWTAFEWSGRDDADARKQREDHLESLARKIEDKLIGMVPRWEPRCVSVRTDGTSQLMFELTVQATDGDDARRRAMYRIGRGLSVKIAPDRNAKVRDVPFTNRRAFPAQERTLNPPWGRCEVEEVAPLRVVG